jgi:hypothetical protein
VRVIYAGNPPQFASGEPYSDRIIGLWLLFDEVNNNRKNNLFDDEENAYETCAYPASQSREALHRTDTIQGRLAANPEKAHTRDDPRTSTTSGMPSAMLAHIPTAAQGFGGYP